MRMSVVNQCFRVRRGLEHEPKPVTAGTLTAGIENFAPPPQSSLIRMFSAPPSDPKESRTTTPVILDTDILYEFPLIMRMF